MPTTIRSLGKGLLGNLYFKGKGIVSQTQSATISYTTAGTAQALFTLPANAIVDEVLMVQKTADNAGTTGTLSVGTDSSTAPSNWLNAADLKTAQTAPYTTLPAAYGSVGTSAVTVYGLITETGTASTAGVGFVSCSYHVP